MKSIYAIRWPLALLLFGFLLRVIGAMMKIMHWPGAETFLLVGTVGTASGLIWLIIHLVLMKKK